jgi:TetR/AcrR family acrAB operon transcriptional repressor
MADRTERPTDKAQATRRALIGLAAELFANRGYAQTSIRDVARQASMTTGAIYGHFRNKADLLAQAVSLRTVTDLETKVFPQGTGPAHITALRKVAATYPQRRQLRALIVEGAAAAHTDQETREHLRSEQLSHLDEWIAGYTAAREELGIDPSIDIHDAVLHTWAVEVGLGVLEALGIEPNSKKSWGDLAARFGRSLNLTPAEVDGTTTKSRSRS